ncbi:MAG: prolipoprotein diacylglyceryl transferase [Verrucomicrobiia bacterium]
MQQIAISIGGFELHWYGMFVAAGFLAGVWTAGRRGERDGLNAETVTDLALWIFGGAFLGARLLYIIMFWEEEFSGQPFIKMLAVRSGFVFNGGLIGATLTAFGYTVWKKLPTWKLADAIGPSIALGHALGRLGCYMTGCCFGRACELPWAVKFPVGHFTHPNLVHPVQIYESAMNVGLYLALAWLYRRKRFDGQIFAVYLLGYGVIRSVAELFRGDYPDTQMTGWMTPAHWVSVFLLIAGSALFCWRRSIAIKSA